MSSAPGAGTGSSTLSGAPLFPFTPPVSYFTVSLRSASCLLLVELVEIEPAADAPQERRISRRVLGPRQVEVRSVLLLHLALDELRLLVVQRALPGVGSDPHLAGHRILHVDVVDHADVRDAVLLVLVRIAQPVDVARLRQRGAVVLHGDAQLLGFHAHALGAAGPDGSLDTDPAHEHAREQAAGSAFGVQRAGEEVLLA